MYGYLNTTQNNKQVFFLTIFTNGKCTMGNENLIMGVKSFDAHAGCSLFKAIKYPNEDKHNKCTYLFHEFFHSTYLLFFFNKYIHAHFALF